MKELIEEVKAQEVLNHLSDVMATERHQKQHNTPYVKSFFSIKLDIFLLYSTDFID